jgi:hypothetical protein
MKLVKLATVNGIPLEITSDNRLLVPLKPICEALGLNFSGQFQKIKDNDFLSEALVKERMESKNGKSYLMSCLPLKYVLGWIMTINPKNLIKEECKTSVNKYKKECYDVMFDYITSDMFVSYHKPQSNCIVSNL